MKSAKASATYLWAKIHLPCFLAVLYSAPPIPAEICWNPQESAGMGPESRGMGLVKSGSYLRFYAFALLVY